MTSCNARVEIMLASSAEAQVAAAALAPDNGLHLKATTRGAVLVLEGESASALGLLRSLDDALACLRATGIA